MIQCNLKSILKARKISVLKLSKSTGLSRTAINPLYHNTGRAVHFETLDRICKELNIDLHDLFSYSGEPISKSDQNTEALTMKLDDKPLRRFDEELDDKTWAFVRDNPSLYAGTIAQEFERVIHKAMLAGQDNAKIMNHALSYAPIRKEVIGLLSKEGYEIDYAGLVQNSGGVVQGFIQARWCGAERFQGGGYYE